MMMANNAIEKLMMNTSYGDTPSGSSNIPGSILTYTQNKLGGQGNTPAGSSKALEVFPVKQSTLTTLLVDGIRLDDSDCDEDYSGSISADSSIPLQTFGMD